MMVSWLLVPAGASACYWDNDTLAMEKKRFPKVLQLVTGKFLRHSSAYYGWRVTDRTTKLEDRPGDLALRDDLAVGLDKLGRHNDAIRVLEGSLQLKPARYETHANLATVLIHAGRLKDGLAHIDKALAINPDAHFGREVIQKRLVEYVLAQKNARPLEAGGPLDKVLARLEHFEGRANSLGQDLMVPFHKPVGFARYLAEHKVSLEDGLKGVLGMMKFGNYDSPVLLEALGDLLLARRQVRSDGKRLAARAYLRAAAGAKTEESRTAYRGKAVLAPVGYRNVTAKSVAARRCCTARAEPGSAPRPSVLTQRPPSILVSQAVSSC
jgi:tetratricopeptide (TPR) repeat protein